MTQKKKKYRSFSQPKIKAICDELCDNIDILCETFELDCKISNKMITMSCPIHGGDNESALNLYHTGDTYRGNWVCRTHHCEKIFQPSIIGFLRGILSVRDKGWEAEGDDMFSFNETLDMALKLIDKDVNDIKINTINKDKRNFIQKVQSIADVKKTNNNNPTRETVRKFLSIPAQYYIDRGFSPKILDKYDVGYCDNPSKEMFDRVVVPVYDMEYTHMVGCTGRSVHDRCNKCKLFHRSDAPCVDKKYGWKHSKWRHNKDFKSKDHLYNIWFARKHILETGVAVIVESPGNVWRLEEAGIKNAVAIFGTSLSDRQKMLLDCSGAMSLCLILDSDEAGNAAREQIKEKCYRTYNVKDIFVKENDIADMDIDDIQNIITPEIEKIYV